MTLKGGFSELFYIAKVLVHFFRKLFAQSVPKQLKTRSNVCIWLYQMFMNDATADVFHYIPYTSG